MSTDRATLLVQLKDHLDHEVQCHRRLLDLAEAKQRHIVAGDMQAFSELLRKEQEPLTAMLRLRQLRERILREVADALEMSRDTLRLTQVIERLTGQIRDELRTRITELKTLCERLREVNDSTMVLIRQSLGFVRDILGVLVGEAPSSNYDRRGTTASVRGQRGGLVNLAG
jgi:flagellar biosynthesis/type III secretory pathway chaperone